MENQINNQNNMSQIENNKNKIIAFLAILVLVLVGVIVYFLFAKPTSDSKQGSNTPDPTPKDVALTEDEAIKIAKEKLKESETIAYEIKDTCFDGKEVYGETEGSEESLFCFYDTVENFKNKFYNVYSKKLVYKDVMYEYTFPGDNHSTNLNYDGQGDFGNIPGYAVKNNKVYTRGCNIGGGTYDSMDKFTVVSITNDTIKINYVVMESDIIDENKVTERENATIILVKEDGNWKILKATIVDICNGVYTIGKES